MANEPNLLLTPHDKFSQVIDGNKKQKAARFTKYLLFPPNFTNFHRYQGDLCLLSGSVSDALDYYNSSVELCKVHQDWLWIASAYEGIARAKLIQLKGTRSSLVRY